MTQHSQRLSVAAIVLAFLIGCTDATAGFAPDGAVQKLITERVDAGHNTGIAAAVADSEGVRYFFAGSSGKQDAALQKNTVFEIGSITKLFTGLLLAEAVQRGEVQLDDTIASFLPKHLVANPDAANITLLDLATHTSGLPRMPENWQAVEPAAPYAHYDAHLLHTALGAADPGLKNKGAYLYSNFGAGLLGYLLTRASGMDYSALVKTRITVPLGLKDTGVRLSSEQTERLAQGHADKNTAAPPWHFGVLAGAGAVKSTPQDLARYLASCMNIRPDTLQTALQMTLTPYRPGPDGVEMGLGWHIIKAADRTFYFHDGGTGGFRAFIGFVAGAKNSPSGIVLLSNTAADVSDMGMHILDTRFGLSAPRKAIRLPSATLDEYAGHYRYRPGNALIREGTEAVLTRTDDGLLYDCSAMAEQGQLLPLKKDLFFFASSHDVTLMFRRNARGQVAGYAIHGAEQQLQAEKTD